MKNLISACILIFIFSGIVHHFTDLPVYAGLDPSKKIYTEDSCGDQEKYTEIRTRLEDLRVKLNIPGMSSAIVKNGEIVWAEGSGYADINNKIPFTADTPYRLASLTKTFASTIIMQLVEAGKIDLDDPISEYGISFGNKSIKVRHLLTHTSGDPPGERYKYDGNRFSYLGAVIMHVTEKSFNKLLDEQIIKSLGLKNTGADLSELSVKPAVPYETDKNGRLIRSIYPGRFSVSAGLFSSAVDIAKYNIAIDSNQFVSMKTQDLIFSPTISHSGRKLPYGLGWFTQQIGDKHIVWHYGYFPPSVSTLIIKIPEDKLTFILLANSENLSKSFNLGMGDVTNSPAAKIFLETFGYD
ncbi:serine hydrolase domain-containing protein [candidate division KSB1 bacterium]